MLIVFYTYNYFNKLLAKSGDTNNDYTAQSDKFYRSVCFAFYFIG
jgi:hypothetical protein